MNNNHIDVIQVIDNSKFCGFHAKLLAWCLFIIIFDGYDLVIYGVALPLLMEQWSLSAVQAGFLASTALFGMMFGALIFGTLSDKWGRKNTILMCVFLFSGFTILGAFARDPSEFALLRFIAGLGIGGVMPNIGALMTEYAPKKNRSFLVALMFSGYCVGGMISALIGIFFVKGFGWEILFYIAGLPLILLPLMWKTLPDSSANLMKSNKIEKVKEILSSINPKLNLNQYSQLYYSTQNLVDAPVKALFSNNRATSTFMFWLSFFMCLLMVYALGNWLPKMMVQAGYSLGASILFLFALNIGGMIGSILGGFYADKFNLKIVISTMFLIGSVSLILLGFKTSTYILYFLITIAGAATIGCQILLYAFVSQYYPATVRSTGVGWASGVGRAGAILGPILIGMLISLGLNHEVNFMVIAIPGVVAAIAIFLVNMKYSIDSEKIIKNTQSRCSIE